MRFLDVATVVNPTQLLKAIVVGLSRQIVERVSQEMDVAALPDGFRERLFDGFLEPLVGVGDNQFDAR